MRRIAPIILVVLYALAGVIAAWQYQVPMSWPKVPSVASISTTSPSTTTAPAAIVPLTDEEVLKAMERAVNFLKSRLAVDRWEPAGAPATPDEILALTATAYRALRGAGSSGATWASDLSEGSPGMVDVGTYLLSAIPSDLHTTALHVLAVSTMHRSPLRDSVLAADRTRILNRLLAVSLSVNDAQLATQAVLTLADCGVEMPGEAFRVFEQHWRITQEADGTWVDAAVTPPTPTLANTVPGITSLFLLVGIQPKPLRLTASTDTELDLARGALERVVPGEIVPDSRMNAITLLGPAVGVRSTRRSPWYAEIAISLQRRQEPDGSILAPGTDAVESTSQALAFLDDYRLPIIISKLQTREPSWDARTHDVAIFVAWLSKMFERRLGWQVVSIESPIELWRRSPILLIAGSDDPRFTKDDLVKLRGYVESGGTILSVAQGGSVAFTRAITEVAAKVVDKKYEFRELAPNHPLFSPELWMKIRVPPIIQGLSNGTREIWLHNTSDMTASWQGRKYPITGDFDFAASVYRYVYGKSAPLPSHAFDDAKVSNPGPFRLSMARLDHAGNADPEPGAWPRLAKFLHGESRAELTVEMIPIRQLNVTQYPLAHFAGTTKFSILPKDVGVLAKYVNEGGTLVIESIGGSADFSASARELIKTIFPDGVPVLHQLPADHPMIQSPYAQGFKLKDEIEFRKYSNIKHGRRETNAQIFAAYIDDRPAVLLSDFDITSGLLGTNTWGIDGYSPETSLKLAANLVIWAADNNPRPRLPQRQPVINH